MTLSIDETQEELYQPSNPTSSQTLSDDLKEHEVTGITSTIEESEDKSEPSNTHLLSDKHSILQPEYHSQHSFPKRKQSNISVNFDRSKSDPAYIPKRSKSHYTSLPQTSSQMSTGCFQKEKFNGSRGKAKSVLLKDEAKRDKDPFPKRLEDLDLNNIPSQIFDKFYTRIVAILSEDKDLSDHFIEVLHADLLLPTIEKNLAGQLLCLDIRNRTVVGAISKFLSRAQYPERGLTKVLKTFTKLKKLEVLTTDMKREGQSCIIEIE